MGGYVVKIERDQKMTEVNVRFLVTTQKLNDTILAFNAVKPRKYECMKQK